MRRWNKFHAKPVTIDGIRFDSTGEGNRYRELKSLQQAGEITQLTCHPKFPIVIKDQHICFVVLDFSYRIGDDWIFEDFKGVYTRESRLRHKMFKAYYGQPVKITRAATRRLSRRKGGAR